MSYDYHGGSFSNIIGHNSPLYARKGEKGDERTFNVVSIVIYCLENDNQYRNKTQQWYKLVDLLYSLFHFVLFKANTAKKTNTLMN